MKLLILGAAGEVGQRLTREACDRGHTVTAVARQNGQLKGLHKSITCVTSDIMHSDVISQIVEDHDIIISALRPPQGEEHLLLPLTKIVLAAASKASVRAIIIGGAARLTLPEDGDHTVLSKPGFLPPSVVPIAKASLAQYELCYMESLADWTYLSPPALLYAGERTGRYQRGSHTLLYDANGNSQISMEDLAVAVLDEAENQLTSRTGFTVAAAS